MKHGLPWKLLFIKEYPDRASAMKEESRLKREKSRS